MAVAALMHLALPASAWAQSPHDESVVASMAMPAVTQEQRTPRPMLDQAYGTSRRDGVQAALPLFEAAVDEQVGSLSSLRALGHARALAGDLSGAHTALLRAAMVEPEHSDTLEMLAIVRHRTGDYSGALSMFERVLRIDADCGAAWLGLARTHLALGHATQATAPAQRAFDLRIAGSRQVLSDTLRATGDVRQARQVLRDAP